MTKATINYNNGKIYKIEPICEYDEGEIYIGSTTKQYLSQRFTNHRAKYNQYIKDGVVKMTSFKLFDKYGIDNCQIVLLELVDVNSKAELHQREAYYIRTLKCINKNIPITTIEEKKEQKKVWEDVNKEKRKEQKKVWEDVNKEKRKEQKKVWEDVNKEKRKEQKKVWEEANKDKIKEQKKVWKEANKDKINERRRELRKLKKNNNIINIIDV
jgi:hypothetical protein